MNTKDIIEALYPIKRLLLFIASTYGKEARKKIQLPLRIRTQNFFRGFRPETYYHYDLEHNDWKYYLNDLDGRRIAQLIPSRKLYFHFVQNKLLFSYFTKHVVRVPEIYAVVMEGDLRGLSDGQKVQSPCDILKLCETKRSIIMKPYDGGQGKSVFQLTYNEYGYKLNNELIDVERLAQWMKKKTKYLIMEMVQQAEYVRNIYPHTPNTIRFLTFIDPYTKEPFIASAGHKIGTKFSYPVDSVQRGGLAVNIDVETGVMTEACDMCPKVYKSLPLVTYDKHPETGGLIKGVRIPNWKQITQQILDLAERFSFLEVVGWDTIISDDGLVVIEGNLNPGYKLTQAYMPMLADERIKRFLNYYGIAKKRA